MERSPFVTRYHRHNPGRAEIMGLYRMSVSDPWGDTMGMFFAVADVLYHLTAEAIPNSWEYIHGLGCTGVDPESWPDSEVAELYEAGHVTADDLLYVGNVMDRYAGWLHAAGQSY